MKERLGKTGKLPWFSSSGRFRKDSLSQLVYPPTYFVFIWVSPVRVIYVGGRRVEEEKRGKEEEERDLHFGL